MTYKKIKILYKKLIYTKIFYASCHIVDNIISYIDAHRISCFLHDVFYRNSSSLVKTSSDYLTIKNTSLQFLKLCEKDRLKDSILVT